MNLPQEQTVVISGVEYRLSKFTIPLYQEFLSWAKAQLPDPWVGIAEKVKGLPTELAKYLIDKAEERAAKRGTVADPDTEALAQTPSGLRKMIGLMFRKYQPGMTEEQVAEAVDAGIAERGEDFFASCFPEGVRDVSAKPSRRR